MRIDSIDILRGIAILGILFMNITYHANIELNYVPFENPPNSDKWVTVFNAIFSDGRFRTLFCLLFGVGLAIQYQSCQRKGINHMIFLKSRLFWLAIFGGVHALFIFGGDILMLYSLAAFQVIKSLDSNQDVLLKKAIRLISIGCILCLVFGIGVLFAEGLEAPIYRSSEAFLTQYEMWYGNYPYQVLVQGGVALAVILFSFISILWQVLGLMYMGIYLYRAKFFSQGFKQHTVFKLLALALTFSAISLLPYAFFEDITSESLMLLASISAVFMSLLYAHLIIRIVKKTPQLLHVFAATGKIAFSLYILQSIAMAILLRWLIPDFNMTATQLDYFLIAVVFTGIQLILANVYLRYFTQGPLEVLWRKLYVARFRQKSTTN